MVSAFGNFALQIDEICSTKITIFLIVARRTTPHERGWRTKPVKVKFRETESWPASSSVGSTGRAEASFGVMSPPCLPIDDETTIPAICAKKPVISNAGTFGDLYDGMWKMEQIFWLT